MSGFSDNSSKILVDGYLWLWPSVRELAPIQCYKESLSHAREQRVGVREASLRRALRAEL